MLWLLPEVHPACQGSADNGCQTLVMDLGPISHKGSLAGIFIRVNHPNLLFPNTRDLSQAFSKLSDLVARVAGGDQLKFCPGLEARWLEAAGERRPCLQLTFTQSYHEAHASPSHCRYFYV